MHLTLHLKVLQTVIVFWEGSILSHCFVAFGFEDSFLCWKVATTPDSYNLVLEKCNKTIRVSFSMILFVSKIVAQSPVVSDLDTLLLKSRCD